MDFTIVADCTTPTIAGNSTDRLSPTEPLPPGTDYMVPVVHATLDTKNCKLNFYECAKIICIDVAGEYIEEQAEKLLAENYARLVNISDYTKLKFCDGFCYVGLPMAQPLLHILKHRSKRFSVRIFD